MVNHTITTTTAVTLTSVLNLTSSDDNDTITVIGECATTSYIIPDVIFGTSRAGETTLGTTTYAALSYANNTLPVYVVLTITSQDWDAEPSNAWSVTVCTYG